MRSGVAEIMQKMAGNELEIELGTKSLYVGSNPTLSANSFICSNLSVIFTVTSNDFEILDSGGVPDSLPTLFFERGPDLPLLRVNVPKSHSN